MQLGQALVARRAQVGRVHVVLDAQRRQQIVAELVARGDGRARPRDLVQPERRGPRRHEPLVDVHLHRLGMVHRQQPGFVQVPGLPQLLGESQLVAPVPGPEQPPPR